MKEHEYRWAEQRAHVEGQTEDTEKREVSEVLANQHKEFRLYREVKQKAFKSWEWRAGMTLLDDFFFLRKIFLAAW